jgi:hypothetical protein
VVTLGTEVNFQDGTSVTDFKESAMLPWDLQLSAPINDVNNVTPNSTHPLFLLLGFQFYQQVNGDYYPLKAGSFNALKIVEVNAV